ncbi:MAG: S1C family serine protease [Candidatus Eiseniibacteriota bacterium]
MQAIVLATALWIVGATAASAAPAASAPVTPAPTAITPAAGTPSPGPTEAMLVEIAQRVQPAVVNIRRFVRDEKWWNVANEASKAPGGWREGPATDLLYPGFRPAEGATGFIVTADGHILSLNRVVADPALRKEAEVLDVEVGDTHYRARVLSLEPTIDLAILKIMAPTPLPFIELGNSGEVKSGQFAYAFGDPTGPDKTINPGVIVQTPSRECYQEEMSATYIQTSMSVCAGALGGPLVNVKGEVIGINTRPGHSAARESAGSGTVADPEECCGHALPINLATAIYQSLLVRESRDSPWLGISVLLLSDYLRGKLNTAGLAGIYIDNVFDPSPASRAGIKVGDVLQTMDGRAIRSVYDFQHWLYMAGVGKDVKLGIVRDRKLLELTARVEPRPPDATTR